MPATRKALHRRWKPRDAAGCIDTGYAEGLTKGKGRGKREAGELLDKGRRDWKGILNKSLDDTRLKPRSSG